MVQDLLFPSPGVLPNPGIEPVSTCIVGGFFTTEPPRKFILLELSDSMICALGSMEYPGVGLEILSCKALTGCSVSYFRVPLEPSSCYFLLSASKYSPQLLPTPGMPPPSFV